MRGLRRPLLLSVHHGRFATVHQTRCWIPAGHAVRSPSMTPSTAG